MEFRILGPLEVRDDRGPLAVTGHKPRGLLALLLLHANAVVPAGQLTEALWGLDAPEAAPATLRLNISRLRKAIPADVLVTRSPGYVVRVRPDELDLHRFERLVDEGRQLLSRDRVADASERLGSALALWTGSPLSEFADQRFAQPRSSGWTRSDWRRSSCVWTPTSRWVATASWSGRSGRWSPSIRCASIFGGA